MLFHEIWVGLCYSEHSSFKRGWNGISTVGEAFLEDFIADVLCYRAFIVSPQVKVDAEVVFRCFAVNIFSWCVSAFPVIESKIGDRIVSIPGSGAPKVSHDSPEPMIW